MRIPWRLQNLDINEFYFVFTPGLLSFSDVNIRKLQFTLLAMGFETLNPQSLFRLFRGESLYEQTLGLVMKYTVE